MEDLSVHLKQCFEDFYKKKPETLGSLKNRVTIMNESRKSHRLDAVLRSRNIPDNLSPYQSPLPKIAKASKKGDASALKKEEKPPNKRLEMLAKWKADKEKQKLDEKRRNKPVFKVSSVPKEVGLPNLENVNREIKGKQFKSKFAPTNHKFKPPANIKPIQFTNQPETRRMVTRSQTQKVQNVIIQNKNTKASTPKSRTRTNSKMILKEKEHSNNNRAVTPKEMKILKGEEHSSDSKAVPDDDKPILNETEPSSSKALNINDEKTPDKQGPPMYLSPFITLSRGKDNARKEYHAKKSGNWEYSGCTSPKAGAAYFTWCLDNQISRLKELCNDWDKYKIEKNPPEEAVSMIDVALGQTNLLITKKFEQFRGLIDRCRSGDSETPVTLEDLHGFWDMILIQVKNLDIRFENLDKLQSNNWEEIVPEVKKQAIKRKGKASKTVKASEGLRAAILAARRRKQETEAAQKTPLKRKSLVDHVTSSQTKGSPGLTMMKVAQYAKGVETPSKSILKSKEKSAKSHKKTVLFYEAENDFNSANIEAKEKTPRRRSKRLNGSKLF